MADGKLELSNGCIYEGDIVNGKPHGKGKNKCEFSEYEGDFVNGEKHGKGKYKNCSGVFEGDFVNGDITKGKFTGNNGDTYEGNFANNFRRNGEGKYTFKDGKAEDGYWHDDKYMGAGDAGKLKMEEEEIRAKEVKENRSSDDYYDAWTGEKR
jgi:hypothetical protein